MKTPVSENINRILIAAFSLTWVGIILISYLGFHPYYFTSLIEMPNASLVFSNLLIAGGAWAWWVHSGKPGRTRKVNGFQVYGLFLLLQISSLLVFNANFGLLDAPGILSFLGMNILLHAALFLLFTLAYVAGQPLLSPFLAHLSAGTVTVLSVAVGISLISLVLFLIGAFHIYTTLVAGILTLGILGLRYRQVLRFWQVTLLKRSAYKYENRWLQIPLFLLLTTLAVNGMIAVKPFPTGFDGAALYMNTTKLIVEYQGLVQGGQAYNWQLILSLGEVLFGKTVFSIGIAHFAFILVLLAAFRLARVLLGRSWSWAAVWLLSINPSFSFHFIHDEKVDLGFTFITIAALLLMIEFWAVSRKEAASVGTTPKLPFKLTLEQGMLLLAGWLLGYAFGIKYTGLLGITTALAMIGYRNGSYWLGAAVVAFFAGSLFFFGADRFGYFPYGDTPPYVPGLISVLAGAVCFGLSFRQYQNLKAFVQSALLVGGMSILCFSPWAVHNLASNGQLSISGLLEAPYPTPQIKAAAPTQSMAFAERVATLFDQKLSGANVELSADQKQKLITVIGATGAQALKDLDRQALAEIIRGEILTPAQVEVFQKFRTEGALNSLSETKEKTDIRKKNLFSAGDLARREEIQRYLGYESGFPLYASLPYDLTMNTNILKSQYIDIGLLFLALFPLLLFQAKMKAVWRNAGIAVLSLLLLLLGAWSVEHQEGFARIQEQLSTNSIDAYSGFASGPWSWLNAALLAVSRPFEGLFQALANLNFAGVLVGIIALGIVAGWALRSRWKAQDKKLKYLLVLVLSFGGLWLLVGNGIPWYGFPMLVALMIYLLYSIQQIGANTRSVTAWAAWLSLGSYVICGYSLVFISALQPPKNAGLIYQEPVLRSFAEGLDQNETLSSFKPYLGEAIEYINQNKSDKVYRVGTFFNYHIDFNDRRVLEDNQLGKYDDLMRNQEDEDAFIDLLKASGFRYILFDMNTATLDRTPEKTLTAKTRRFTQMLFTSPKARLIFTDNVVKGDQGETVPLGKLRIPGRAGIRGETVYRGSYLLFEIN
ncbi:MAG: hypothetical protein RIC19_17865 [Phaeodactylibacter sp.]|uniref:hypothetical protein n=1 Tax=Phaeodactylibacter sp. TaxID=1940289 RepID=UPI0032EE40E2